MSLPRFFALFRRSSRSRFDVCRRRRRARSSARAGSVYRRVICKSSSVERKREGERTYKSGKLLERNPRSLTSLFTSSFCRLLLPSFAARNSVFVSRCVATAHPSVLPSRFATDPLHFIRREHDSPPPFTLSLDSPRIGAGAHSKWEEVGDFFQRRQKTSPRCPILIRALIPREEERESERSFVLSLPSSPLVFRRRHCRLLTSSTK